MSNRQGRQGANNEKLSVSRLVSPLTWLVHFQNGDF
jgi:hypothetical protein